MRSLPVKPIPGYKPVCRLENSAMQFEFRVDPAEVHWGYHLEIDEQLTVGGMVKYIRGIVIDSVSITVETGAGGVEELRRIANFVYEHMVHARRTGETLRFVSTSPLYPWDLQVFIRNIGNLKLDGVTKNYKLTLEMSVVKNNLEMDVYEISSLLGKQVEGITNLAMIHIVQAGETLSSIAKRYYGDERLGGKLILEVNENKGKISGEYISPGTRLIIPYAPHIREYSTYVLQPDGDYVNVLENPFYNVSNFASQSSTSQPDNSNQ